MNTVLKIEEKSAPFDEQLSPKMCIGFWHVSSSKVYFKFFSSKCVWKEAFYCMHLRGTRRHLLLFLKVLFQNEGCCAYNTLFIKSIFPSENASFKNERIFWNFEGSLHFLSVGKARLTDAIILLIHFSSLWCFAKYLPAKGSIFERHLRRKRAKFTRLFCSYA